MRCPYCRNPDSTLRPFTTDDLRWYFGGESEAAMGVRSSHASFESMLAAGVPTGGRSNGAENMILRTLAFPGERTPSGQPKLDPIERHRCIRNHRLAGVPTEHMSVLQIAYSGEDWTRLLDERVGRGPRLELQRFFPHDVLQLAPQTPTARKGALAPKEPSEEGEAIYHSERAALGSLRRIVGLEGEATADRVRARLRGLARWLRTKQVPRWGDPAAVCGALRVLASEATDGAALAKVRRLLARSEHPPAASVAFVRKKQRSKPPPTPQSYLVKLMRTGQKDKLERVRDEARRLLSAARHAARICDPHRPRRPKVEKTPREALPAIRPSFLEVTVGPAAT